MESPHGQKQATPKSWNSLGESLYNYCKIILFGFDKYICQLWFIVEYVTLFIFANYDLQVGSECLIGYRIPFFLSIYITRFCSQKN